MPAAQLEMKVLTQVIRNKDFQSLERAQITEQFFDSPEAIQVYRAIRELYHGETTSGLVPSMEYINTQFPGFYAYSSDDPVPILAQVLRDEKVKLELELLAENLKIEAASDPRVALATLSQKTADISSLMEVGHDLTISGAYSNLLSNYETVQENRGVIGIPYPWHPLNEETQGKQKAQFIIFYARPGSMKTWIAVYNAVHDYLVSRRRVMFYTREMHPDLVAQRIAACLCEVDYKAFKNGKLQPSVKDAMFTRLKELAEDEKSAGAFLGHQPCIRIVSDRGSKDGGGVQWLSSKIKEMEPDIVYVDGMYLMKDDRSRQRTVDWKSVAQISQDLKRCAQEYDIPIVGITQANRNAEKGSGQDLTELSYADAIGQDADAVFRLKLVDYIDENKQKVTNLHLTAPKIREGRFTGMVIGAQPATDFTFKRMLTSKDFDDGTSGSGSGGGSYVPKSQFSGPRASGGGDQRTGIRV